MKAFPAHTDAVRDLSFAPTDAKFVSGSNDHSVNIWDLETCESVTKLSGRTGHGMEVNSVHWHPRQALILSGSKDSFIKLWDPRSSSDAGSAGGCLRTLDNHNGFVSRVRWNDNGKWFLSCSGDHLVKVWDIRTMRPFQTMTGHKKEVTCGIWHPTHERVLATGGKPYI